jgi:hypothetical protein
MILATQSPCPSPPSAGAGSPIANLVPYNLNQKAMPPFRNSTADRLRPTAVAKRTTGRELSLTAIVVVQSWYRCNIAILIPGALKMHAHHRSDRTLSRVLLQQRGFPPPTCSHRTGRLRCKVLVGPCRSSEQPRFPDSRIEQVVGSRCRETGNMAAGMV